MVACLGGPDGQLVKYADQELLDKLWELTGGDAEVRMPPFRACLAHAMSRCRALDTQTHSLAQGAEGRETETARQKQRRAGS